MVCVTQGDGDNGPPQGHTTMLGVSASTVTLKRSRLKDERDISVCPSLCPHLSPSYGCLYPPALATQAGHYASFSEMKLRPAHHCSPSQRPHPTKSFCDSSRSRCPTCCVVNDVVSIQSLRQPCSQTYTLILLLCVEISVHLIPFDALGRCD